MNSNTLNPDREMHLGILNAFLALMRSVESVEEICQHDLATDALCLARKEAMQALTKVLLAHPMNKPIASA